MTHQTIAPLALDDSFALVAIKDADFPEQSSVSEHQHVYGQFNMVCRGVMELNVMEQHFLTPPHYALWIPAGVPHSSYQQESVRYNAVYVAPDYCVQLPEKPAIFQLTAVIESLIRDFIVRGIVYPASDVDKRQAHVLLDHFYRITPATTFLPMAESEQLRSVLETLSGMPDNNDSLALWARKVHSTERTLARRCEKELGMSFREWRQRLRLVKAIEMLCENRSIENIALSLGYSTSSSFIAMFKRQTGTTPAQYCWEQR